MVNIESLLLKTTLKFHVKYQSLGTPFLKGYGMMCCNVGHTLMLKCLITFLRYIRILGRASGSFYNTFHGQHRVITVKNNSQISCKMSAFGHPLHTLNEMLCCKKRHPLLFGCSVTFARYMRMIRRAFCRLYKTIMIHTMSLLPKLSLKFHVKYQLLHSLSAQEMRWSAARRYIHPCLSVLQCSSDM